MPKPLGSKTGILSECFQPGAAKSYTTATLRTQKLQGPAGRRSPALQSHKVQEKEGHPHAMPLATH